MKCPECKSDMEPACMYGNEKELNIDYTCNNCGCIAILKWFPHKKKEVETNNNSVPFSIPF